MEIQDIQKLVSIHNDIELMLSNGFKKGDNIIHKDSYIGEMYCIYEKLIIENDVVTHLLACGDNPEYKELKHSDEIFFYRKVKDDELQKIIMDNAQWKLKNNI